MVTHSPLQSATAYIAAGANIDPESNIPAALARLAETAAITGISTFYHTPAIGRPEQPDYLNGVIAIQTDLAPRSLKFDLLRPIEAALGRVRSADKFAARPIDLDILLCGGLCIDEPDVRIPDPDLRERDFLAAGLLELNPDAILPDTGEPLSKCMNTAAAEGLRPAVAFTHVLRERFLS